MRWILHSDMNSFFASVELLYRSDLRGRPVAVCGSVAERHGIVLAKSDEAMRYGIKTAETISEANSKCRDLRIISPHYELYKKYSKMAKEIYERYSDKVEPFGPDECWIDVTFMVDSWATAVNLAIQIKNTIKAELGLNVSIGVAHNKFLAKMGSKLAKRNGIKIIDSETWQREILPLDLTHMFGCGKATREKLAKYAVKTIMDLAGMNYDFCAAVLGKNGTVLWRWANGVDTSPVISSYERRQSLSLSHGITCRKDLHSINEIRRVIQFLLKDIVGQLHRSEIGGSSIEIIVKFVDLKARRYTANLLEPLNSYFALERSYVQLLQKEGGVPGDGVRAVTIGISTFKKIQAGTGKIDNIGCNMRGKADLTQTWYKLRKLFGSNALYHAGEAIGGNLPNYVQNEVC
ncbi:putative DNA polymerase IV [Mageeibacillus indolicus UPII9-5]|uniref:Putative DNA polymerase IV n=1 Tax=Mageeibacillus indolicus (strain UPII9-5) TaxID=699246 RepID=D3QZ51_MAGIU|nr:DNA polymerase IV [Mageeibacillus indolicus]ADC91735.1 putative DNA polymerase IV [Mageeibacillus indolicus UPII9-5]